MDSAKIDLLLEYALAVSGEQDRELRGIGRTQLVKYVYFADLVYAERHRGETFTGAPWRFYKFGPWAREVAERIDPLVHSIGAKEMRISSSKYEDDVVRWELEDQHAIRRIEAELPTEVSLAIRSAVRDFAGDLSMLIGLTPTTWRRRRVVDADARHGPLRVPEDSARVPADVPR